MSKATWPEPGWERAVPRTVTQKTTLCCWAAALESWMSVTPQSTMSWCIKTQDDALKEYKPFLVNSGGSLDVRGDKFKDDKGKGWVGGVQFMAAGVGMDLKVFVKGSLLTAAVLYEKLKNKGHLYVMYGSSSIGHAFVVYRIVNPFSPKAEMSIMDPWPGKGLRTMLVSDLKQEASVIVGWPE